MASGLAVGALRLAAIDRGAFHGPIGRPATARGVVTAVPHRSTGEVRVRIQTADGRLRDPIALPQWLALRFDDCAFETLPTPRQVLTLADYRGERVVADGEAHRHREYRGPGT